MGDGTAGHVTALNLTGSATGSIQIDFAQPISAIDRLLFIDVDFTEQYHIEAFSLQGASYVPLSLLGWTHQTLSGQTGVIPDSRWPTWSPASGLLTANSSPSGLNEELSVLTPDQPLSRLIITKTTGAGASTGFQVIELPLLPADVNHDGIVNGQDIALVASNWLATGTGATGDVNNDGIVNGQDIALIASSWLATSGGSSAEAAAVPEPSTLAHAVTTSWLYLPCVEASCAAACWDMPTAQIDHAASPMSRPNAAPCNRNTLLVAMR